MIRHSLITVLLVSVTTYTQAEQTTNVIEELNNLKQRLILEQMAGEGKTPLQRSLRKHLDREDTTIPKRTSPTHLLSPYSADKPRIQQFEAQYIAPDGCENWRSERHMVECQNHKIRSREIFLKSTK